MCRSFGTYYLFHFHRPSEQEEYLERDCKGVYTGKVLAQKSGPIGRRSEGEGRVRVKEQAVEGKGPHWRPVVKGYKGGTVPFRSEEEDPWDGSDLTIVFHETV